MRSFSLEQARAMALEAGGFLPSATDATLIYPARRHLQQLGAVGKTVARNGLLQIDTVNVFARAHTMPTYSRFGTYPLQELNALMGVDQPELIEYWAHEASLIPAEDYALFGWRRAEYVSDTDSDSSFWSSNPDLVSWMLREIETRGPLTASELEHDASQSRGGWWGWSDLKRLLVAGFLRGDLVAWGRKGSTRVFDLADRHRSIFETTLSLDEQKRELLLRAAWSLGIGREADLADYYRMPKTEARPLLAQLVESGDLQIIDVAGEQAFTPVATTEMSTEHEVGSSSNSAATLRATLLSPFDPLVWYRPRTEWLWGFRYRIEIYTPAAKRQFGYYTLPVLFENQIVGRIDLKTDRKSKTLLVRAAWHELQIDGVEPDAGYLDRICQALANELRTAAEWQGCRAIEVSKAGNLSSRIKKVLLKEKVFEV